MTDTARFTLDPELDLVLERTLDAPPALIWKAWTTPEYLAKWFCPRPWSVAKCELDLRPGGIFRTDMRSPDGEVSPNTGCFLEVVPERRLVWTDALAPGFRPTAEPFMTGVLLLEPIDGGTRYRAIAMHADLKARERHEEMGFHEGWGAAYEQLLEVLESMKAGSN